ncbi:MAG TPA: YgiT-type zinc finger protein [Candidatus Wujingus californicus]|uniref:YgiT-type zinc finger protein n=1 Tax=Candidatus Wujingus californicus TaxID=3367618 RepID=UPI004026D06D
MKDTLCAICGGSLQNQKVTIDRLVDNRLYLFENVQVQACDSCQEIWIPGNEVERMEQAIKGQIKPSKQIVVPVY